MAQRLQSAVNQVAATLAVTPELESSLDGIRLLLAEVQQRIDSFEQLVSTSSDLIATVTYDGVIRSINASIVRMLGSQPDDVVGRDVTEMIYPDDRLAMREALAVGMDGRSPTEGWHHRFLHKGGSPVWLTWRLTPTMHTGLFYLLGQPKRGIDLTPFSLGGDQEAGTDKRDGHDSWTQLPNRTLFVQRLQTALQESRAEHPVVVMFLDLDGFRVVNDSLGYQVGDQLLASAAQRLAQSIPSEATLARICGDEFAVLIPADAVVDPVGVADHIVSAFHEPFVISGQEMLVTLSVGIVVSGLHRDAHLLLRDAVVAMYEAKGRGKGYWVLYDPKMRSHVVERLQVEADLRRAVERKEFTLHYQPVVGLEISRIIGLEALVRWEHPQRGLIQPTEFIPLAEETGLILPLGDWILREACLQMRQWQEEHPDNSPLFVSVNLSVKQVQQPSLPADLRQILAETGLSADSLQLEITESVMMKDDESTIATLRALRDLGVKLAIDDFGTGYSSLRYLKRLPIDTLKIDRSFVKGLGRDPKDTAIVRTVITFAKALNLVVNGEGIETVQQLAHLLSMGCDIGQGFYFRKPLTKDEIGDILERNSRW
jgi:diguanylate cyclase (GGDEF)-like protein/PAS domain S-box-containing protein